MGIALLSSANGATVEPVSELLHSRITIDGGVATVFVEGECDASCANALRQALENAVAQTNHVVVDLRGLTFADSSLIHVLDAATAAARGCGTTLEVRNAAGVVARVLELTRTEA
jgi:anti-anti-sigma factor